MSKIKIISKVRIGGELVPQESIPPEEFQRLLRDKVKDVIESIGFEMKNTA